MWVGPLRGRDARASHASPSGSRRRRRLAPVVALGLHLHASPPPLVSPPPPMADLPDSRAAFPPQEAALHDTQKQKPAGQRTRRAMMWHEVHHILFRNASPQPTPPLSTADLT